MSTPNKPELITPAHALGVIAQWDPCAAPNEEGGLSIMEAIDLAQAALANMQPKPPMTDAEYVSKNALHCPFCDSKDIEADDVIEASAADPLGARCYIVCRSCNKEWYDDYKLVGYHNA
jgi:hypothetical protein